MTDLIPSTYDRLRDQIVQVIEAGRARARSAVEQEKVKACWEVGRLLHEHLLAFKERAEYGEQLLPRLAEDLEIGLQRLYEMLGIYRSFPNFRALGDLSFSHYVRLLSVKEGEVRDLYAEKAQAEKWSVRQLDQAIRAGVFPQEERSAEPAAVKPFAPRRGRLFTYRLVADARGRLLVDLGFGGRFAADLEGLEGARASVCLRSVKQGDGYRLEVDRSKRTKLYTYRALVAEVIDGDTVWVDVDCGFGVWSRQKLRLRGIDTPELGTAAGERARLFSVEALRGVEWVVLTTSRADKYDRYLADLFYRAGEVVAEQVVAEGACLNLELLNRGLAVRFAE